MIQPGLLAGALHAAPVSVGDLTAQSLTVGVAATIDFTTQVSVASDAALTAGTWSVQSGTVPSGMTHTDGVVSGTPDTTQSATTLTLRYTNSGGYVDVGGVIRVNVSSGASDFIASGDRVMLLDPSVAFMYQDLGQTTISSVGDPVAYVVDEWSLNDAGQGTDIDRPTLRTGSGKTWLEFDGSSDALEKSSVDLETTCSIVVAVDLDATGISNIHSLLSYNSTPDADFQLQAGTAGEFHAVLNATGIGVNQIDNGVSYTGKHVWTLVFDAVAGTCTFRLDGEQKWQSTSYNGALAAIGTFRLMAARGGAQNPPGDVYYACLWNTDQNVTDIEAIAADRIGVTLVTPAAPTIASVGSVSGDQVDGAALSLSGLSYTGTGTTVAYQWLRNGSDIAGATYDEFVPRRSDIGANIACRVTVTNGSGSASDTTATVGISEYEEAIVFNPIETVSGVTLVDSAVARTDSDANYTTRTDFYFGPGDNDFYFELTVPSGNTSSGWAYVGITNYFAAKIPSAGALQSTGVTFVRANGGVTAVSNYGNAIANSCDLTNGDTIRVAVDVANRKVYFGTNAGWYGDPVAKTNGFDLPSDLAEWTVLVCPRTTASSTFSLLSREADLVHTPPTGYVAMSKAKAAEEVTAAPAKIDDFVDMIGICLHLSWQNTEWGTEGNLWKPLLKALPIRYARTLIGSQASAQADATELHTDMGLTYLTRLMPEHDESGSGGDYPVYYESDVDSNLDAAINGWGLDKVLGFEGPNEPNEGSVTAGWETRTKNIQQYAFDEVNANALTQDFPVLPPTMWSRSETDAALIGPFTGMCDRSNLHYYTAGKQPTISGTEERANVIMDECMQQSYDLGLDQPLWVTEYGYRVQDNPASLDAWTVSPEVASKYLVRGLFEFWNRGAEKVFIYGFFDDHSTTTDYYGLVARTDTLIMEPRHQYYTMQRWLTLFAELGVAFTPTALRYNLTGNLSRVAHAMFQKSDGTYFLVIWSKDVIWDRTTISELSNPDRTIKLGLDKKAASIVKRQPSVDGTSSTVATDVMDLDLAVPDHAVVYEITLA